MEQIAGCVIRKHPKSVMHTFRRTKEKENELLIMDGLSKENTLPITDVSSTSNLLNGAHYTIPNCTTQ